MRIIMDSFKHRKMYELQDVSVNEDKISNLPDCILQHILSFLPTKEAVATCILSTRWQDLWTFVPYVDFDDALLYSGEENGWYPLKMTCFMNFVERVLLLRHGSNLEKFCLSYRVCFNASRIQAWISAAIKHKVEELNLCLFVEIPFTLPRCVFNSESLTVVKIEMYGDLELPTCISFPQLKTLHLALVTFTDYDSTQKLLSSCPVLQDLALLNCEWMNLKRIMVSIPTLKSLTIDDQLCFVSGVELNDREIKIDAANLIFLKYRGHLLNKIFLCNLSSLNSASIYVPLYERRKDIGYRAVKLLRGLACVKSMRLSNGTIESLFLADNILDHLPIFHNLTYLELSIEIEKHNIQRLVNLLQYSPNLESLVFVKGVDPHVCFDEEDWIWNPVPKCFLACLKSVSLHNFHGNYAEMCLLRSLLKNALFLERLNVFGSKNLSGDSKMQSEVIDQLQMLPRASTSCLIMLL